MPIEVGPVGWERSASLEAEVDAGLVYCLIPRDVLAPLGVEEEDFWQFELSCQRMMIYPTGFAAIRLAQRSVITRVAFVAEGETLKIGRLALSSASLSADHDNQCLKPVIQKLNLPMRPV